LLDRIVKCNRDEEENDGDDDDDDEWRPSILRMAPLNSTAASTDASPFTIARS